MEEFNNALPTLFWRYGTLKWLQIPKFLSIVLVSLATHTAESGWFLIEPILQSGAIPASKPKNCL